MECLVDTGFNGSLMVPAHHVGAHWKATGYVEYIMADGQVQEAETYSTTLEWLGNKKIVQILAIPCDLPLLGMSLLQTARLVLSPSENILDVS